MIEMTEVNENERTYEQHLNVLEIIAIRVSSKWYKDHLKANGSGEDIEIVLLTDDRGNREKASATGIKSSDGKEMISAQIQFVKHIYSR